MVYIQLRVSIGYPLGKEEEAITDEDRTLFRNIIKKIVDKSDGEYTVGFEKTNKFNEPCKEHFHACYELQTALKKDSYQNKLRKLFKAEGITLKSNAAYAVQLLPEPKDYDRWIRYPLKENPILPLCKVENIDDKILCAKDEKNRAAAAAHARREKAAETTTFKEKMFAWLEKEGKDKTPFTGNEHDIYCKVDEYYCMQGKPITWTTMIGYVHTYERHIKLITASQFYWSNKKQKDGDWL